MILGIILAIFVAILWAFGEVEYSKISKKFDRANVYFYQFFSRTIIYFLVVLIFNISLIGKFDIQKFYLFLPIILCDFFASYVVNISVSNGKLSTVSPIMASYPVLDILFALFLLKEKVGILELVLLSVINISVIILMCSSKKSKRAPHPIKGIIFAIFYMVFIALSTLFEKNIYSLSYTVYDFYYYKALIYFSVSMIFALIIFITPVKIKKPNKDLIKGAILTPVGNVFYSFALSFSDMIIVTPLSSLYSCITSILSMKLLKEKISIREGICISLILICTFILIIIGLL